MLWSQPEPSRQGICVVDGKVREMELSKCSSAQKTLNESQTSDNELYTLFDFGLTSNITMPWFFPLRIIKYTICF